MKKSEKMSITQWEKIYKEYATDETTTLTFEHEGEQIPCVVKRRLNAGDIVTLVNSVCYGVLGDTEDSYRPELQDYFTRISVLEAYTNITLPQSLDKCWRLVYGTPIYAMITGDETCPGRFADREYDEPCIDTEQYRDIVSAIDKKIQHLLDQRVKQTKFSEVLENIQPLITDFLAGFDGANMKEFVNKINAFGKLDTKKLVDAVFDRRESKGEENTDNIIELHSEVPATGEDQ